MIKLNYMYFLLDPIVDRVVSVVILLIIVQPHVIAVQK